MRATLAILVLATAAACGAQHQAVEEDASPPDALGSCSGGDECFLVCTPTCPCPEVWDMGQVEDLRSLHEYCETHDCFDGLSYEYTEYPCLILAAEPSCEMPCLPVAEPACVDGSCGAR